MFLKRSIFIAAATMLVGANASAAVVTTFSYSGQAKAGQVSVTGGPGLPTGGVLRANDPARNFAASVGNGSASPFVYAAGAASAGKASATSNMVVTMQITNDTGAASNVTLSALIFAGAVGIANPNFASPSCSRSAIEACGAFLSGTTALHAGESAALDFSAQLDGATLFGGSIAVDSTGKTSSFTSGFSLTGFGNDPANANLSSWSDTLLNGISLGTFAAGETKTLTFLVAASVATVGGVGCRVVSFGCPLALAGFGDPPSGSGGVIITSRSAPLLSVTFTPTPVPLPGAFLLFGAGLAGLGGMKRLKQR